MSSFAKEAFGSTTLAFADKASWTCGGLKLMLGILWSFAVAMDQTLVFDHQEDSKAFMTPKGLESEN